jgi:peptide chain release factor 1
MNEINQTNELEREIERVRARAKSLEARLLGPLRPEERKEVNREYGALLQILRSYDQYQGVLAEIREAEEMLREGEVELAELAQEELSRLKSQAESLRRQLTPKPPELRRNCIVEIRAAAGGAEAALFVADLFRMYQRFVERQGWRIEVLTSSPSELKGFKEISFLVEGEGAYEWLHWESGVHRVQRVPVTEASGRIHTSTATVAVLPEAQPEELKINPQELKIEVFRASGHGGQHVNVTDSAVRITHLPTGITVSCQDERSQHRNRAKAMKVLEARLLSLLRRRESEQASRERRLQVGTGERAEKIRTYNFPQNRVTDHRIGLSLYKLQEVLDGELKEIIGQLVTGK